MLEIKLQLHGGGGGGSTPEVKQSAPGSSAVATIDSATEGERQRIKEQMMKAKGRKFTNKTGGTGTSSLVETMKKTLLGE